MVNRNQWPSWVNVLVDRIADSPASVIGRLAARRLGAPAPPGSVAATSFAERPIRVLIAPVNYAAQGTAWARALEARRSEISARNMAIDVPGGFSFDADLTVPVGTYHNDVDWQTRQFEAATQATHVLIEAEEPPFGRRLGRSVERQAAALQGQSVDVAYMAHGTDARLPSTHAERSEWSYYRDPSVYLPRAETLARRNIEFLNRSGCPVFVSTPDLLLDLPAATWCPVVVDPARWSMPRTERERGAPLRVVHAPSNPALKGTPLIMPVLERLQAEGVIDFRLIQGIPSADMPNLFAGADVLLDQFRLGSYGVAACEAMATGCIVVGQISEQVRETVAQSTGHQLPIVEADPRSLEDVLRRLSALPDLTQLRRESADFVTDVHDGRRSADALLNHWISPAAPAGREDADSAPSI